MSLWQRIKAFFQRLQVKPAASAEQPPIENISPIDLPKDETPWMTIAQREVGQKEIVGSKDNPRIIEYHSATTLKATDDETPWCSSFVTWCLEKAGYESTKNAWARSYLQCGEKLKTGRYGCIVVFSRGANSGHVGFFLDETETMIYLLGGNQGDAVTRQWYAKDRLLGYRWPEKKA